MMMNSSTSGRKGGICMSVEDGCELRRGPWALEEDNLLIHYITSHGEGQWNSLAKCAGLKRTGKSCRLRWLNYLKPDIKRGNLTPHEQLLILELHTRWGNRWSKIAQHLPGRTDNEIKNYWRTRVQKQARHLKVDSNSSKFLETFRMFWMPRLLEKIEQDHSSSSSITTLENQPLPSSDINNSKLPEVSSGQGQEDEECYHVDVPMQQLDHTCLHVDDGDWMGEGLGSSFWNSDELWELVYREVEPEG